MFSRMWVPASASRCWWTAKIALLALERDHLEGPVVGADQRHPPLREPVRRVPARARLDLLVLVDVLVPLDAPARVQERDVAGPTSTPWFAHAFSRSSGVITWPPWSCSVPTTSAMFSSTPRQIQGVIVSVPNFVSPLARVEVLVVVAVVEVAVDADVPEAVHVAADVVGAGDLLLEVGHVAAARPHARLVERSVGEDVLLPEARRERGYVLGEQLRELDLAPFLGESAEPRACARRSARSRRR